MPFVRCAAPPWCPSSGQKVFINGVQDLAILPNDISPNNVTHDRRCTAFVRVTPTFMFAEAAYVHNLALDAMRRR